MKRMIAFVLCVTMLILSSCQPSPEREPVPNKGDNDNEIALTYLCAGRKDDIERFYWTPMWGFSYEIKGEEIAPLLPGVMFINALDGTFVYPSGTNLPFR